MSFSTHNNTNSVEKINLSDDPVNRDGLAEVTYYSARSRDVDMEVAQLIADDTWYACMDDGGEGSSQPPIFLENTD